jgi:SAM-dependent methyltransferase
MKLSSIVQYLNQIDQLSAYHAAAAAVKEVAKITQIVQYHDIQIGNVSADLITLQQGMTETLAQYEEKLKQLRRDVQRLVEEAEPKYFANSTDNYQQGMRYDTPAAVLARRPQLESHSMDLLQNRLKPYANWRFPGMVIRPAHNPWLEHMVALDPMYFVDTSQDLLAPAKTMFTSEYQRRLRSYVIEEYAPFFDNFPKGQFGVICAFHYFHTRPLEIILQYLDEIFVLLRPGGSFLFSFNDCDSWRAVALAENNFSCYTPGRLIREHITRTGYEITYEHHSESDLTWMEIKKPGTLDSLRGGQALASIFRKPVDKPLKDLYNEMNLDMLIDLAEFLNVDISQAKTKREFNIKKVRNTISEHLETENYPEETLRELFKPKET